MDMPVNWSLALLAIVPYLLAKKLCWSVSRSWVSHRTKYCLLQVAAPTFGANALAKPAFLEQAKEASISQQQSKTGD